MSIADSVQTNLVAVDSSINDFDWYLQASKNVSQTTRSCYIRHVLPFLESIADAERHVTFAAISGPQVRAYVTALGERYAPQSLKLMATSLRCFLRFAWLSNWTSTDLAVSVGPVITHRSGRLPQALSDDELQQLLSIPNRQKLVGVRDYAVLVVLSRLGLRSAELASLRLDDIDWGQACITARVKGGDTQCFPLPTDIGEVLVSYLRRRPTVAKYREVFLQVRGEPIPLSRGAVSRIVARNAAKAGLGIVHAHRLRHTAARAVLDAGGDLTEVSELLGQTTAQVTMGYSSLDTQMLQPLARPWPLLERS